MQNSTSWTRGDESAVLQYLKSPKVNLKFSKQEVSAGLNHRDEWCERAVESVFATVTVQKKFPVKRNSRGRQTNKVPKSPPWLPTAPQFRRLVRIPNNQNLEQLVEWGRNHMTNTVFDKETDGSFPAIDDLLSLRHLEHPLKKETNSIVLAAAHVKKLLKVPLNASNGKQKDGSREVVDGAALRKSWTNYLRQYGDNVAQTRQKCEKACELSWKFVEPILESLCKPEEWESAVAKAQANQKEVDASTSDVRSGQLVQNIVNIATAPLEKGDYDGGARAMKSAECSQRKSKLIEIVEETVSTATTSLDRYLQYLQDENKTLERIATENVLPSLVLIAETCIKETQATSAELVNAAMGESKATSATTETKKTGTDNHEMKPVGRIDRVKLLSDFSSKLSLSFSTYCSEHEESKGKVRESSQYIQKALEACEDLQDLKSLCESKDFQAQVRKLESQANPSLHKHRLAQYWTSLATCLENLSKKVVSLLLRAVQQLEDAVTLALSQAFYFKVESILTDMKKLRHQYEEAFRNGELQVVLSILSICTAREKAVAGSGAVPENARSTKVTKATAKQPQQRQPHELKPTQSKQLQSSRAHSGHEPSTQQKVDPTWAAASTSMAASAAVWGPFARKIVAEGKGSPVDSPVGTSAEGDQLKKKMEALQESLVQRNNYIMKFTKEKDAELASMRHDNHLLHERAQTSDLKLKELQQVLDDARVEVERQTQSMQQMAHVMQRQQAIIQYQAAQLTAQAQYTVQAKAAHSARMAGLTVLHPQSHPQSANQESHDVPGQTLRSATALNGHLGLGNNNHMVNPLLSLARQKGSGSDSVERGGSQQQQSYQQF